ncbi:MAG: chemotaxis protein CheW [Methylotenera sp.]
MAKESQLREYQSSILARLENAKKAGAEAPAGYLGVVIGSKNVLVSLQEISETLPIMDIHRVPIVKPWFLGVANVRGVLYAINDLAQLLENTFTAISSNARLLLMSDAVTSNVAFVVDKMIGLRKLDEMKLRDEIAEETICLKAQIYQDEENRVWHVLDCDKLVNSKEFATPYMV